MSQRDPADLDPRVRAVLEGTDPRGHAVVELPDEVQDMLTAAVAELGGLSAPQPGIGLVLGSGVVSRLVQPRPQLDPSRLPPTPSTVDKRC